MRPRAPQARLRPCRRRGRAARGRRRTRARRAAPRGARRSSPPRSTNSPRRALRRRGSTTSPSRAGVAKGTIYLYFRDKESAVPGIDPHHADAAGRHHRGAWARPTCRCRLLAEQFVELFVREVYETRRKDVIRLMITEGRRFPKLAEFYYREVLSRIIAAVRALLARAAARGEVARRAGRFSATHRRAGPGRRSSGAGCSSASSRSTCAR